MNLPDEFRVAVTVDGVSLELKLRGVPQGFAFLFPDLEDADEFLRSPDLRASVGRAAVSALDAATEQFLRGFQMSSVELLSRSLEAKDGSVDAVTTTPEQEET